jgi:molybdopterin-guanine dinucleotide biosynthesis protein A
MGTPKAILPFGEEVMLARVVRLLAQVVSPIVVVAAKDQVLPPLGPEVLLARDERPQRGPLEGLRAGMKVLHGRAEAAYVTACDVPLLAPAFVEFLLGQLGDADAAVPVEGRDGRPFYHPLAGVYRLRVLPVVERLLASDQLRLGGLIESIDARLLPVAELRAADPELATLNNLNTPEAYEAAQAKAEAQQHARR